jgi:hypothetical protein
MPVGFVPHLGKKIVYVDFRECDESQARSIISDAAEFIRAFPPKSVLVLTDFTDSTHAPQLLQALREFVDGNSPFVKASATVGVAGMKRVLFDAVMKLAGRQVHIFPNATEAKDWLAAQ